jgi:folylpolyglutamate synthase/dihydropteroate synthase
MALMRDKDATGMVRALQRVAKRFVALTVPGNPRAMDADELLFSMRAAGADAVAAQTVEEGMALAGASDVVVCGSLYLYAAFRRWAVSALS